MVGRVAIAVAFATLLAAPAAHAHIRSGVVAVDYRASVYPLNVAEPSSIRARIYESDRALGLTVRSGHTVVVLGYLGEPFLRIGSGGVAVNTSSPTAGAVGLTNGRGQGYPERAHLARSLRRTHDRVARRPCRQPSSRRRAEAVD